MKLRDDAEQDENCQPKTFSAADASRPPRGPPSPLNVQNLQRRTATESSGTVSSQGDSRGSLAGGDAFGLCATPHPSSSGGAASRLLHTRGVQKQG